MIKTSCKIFGLLVVLDLSLNKNSKVDGYVAMFDTCVVHCRFLEMKTSV